MAEHNPTPIPARLASAAGTGKHRVVRDACHPEDIASCLEDFRAYIHAEYRVSLVGELKADGQFHGMRTDEDRHGGKPFRVCFFLDHPQCAYFVDLKRGFSGLWFPKGQEPLSPAERDRLRCEAEARRVERDRQVRAFHENAAKRARAMWRLRLKPPPDHGYLLRKHVDAYGLGFLPAWERPVEAEGKPGQFETLRIPNALLVPMRDETGALWNLQAIFPEISSQGPGRRACSTGSASARPPCAWPRAMLPEPRSTRPPATG